MDWFILVSFLTSSNFREIKTACLWEIIVLRNGDIGGRGRDDQGGRERGREY